MPLKVSFSYYQDRHTRNRSPIEHKPKIIMSIEGPRLAVSSKMDFTSLNETHFSHQSGADFFSVVIQNPSPYIYSEKFVKLTKEASAKYRNNFIVEFFVSNSQVFMKSV